MMIIPVYLALLSLECAVTFFLINYCFIFQTKMYAWVAQKT